MDTGKFILRAILRWTSILFREELKYRVVSHDRNQDKPQSYEPLGSFADLVPLNLTISKRKHFRAQDI